MSKPNRWSSAREIALLVVLALLTTVAIGPLLRADQPCTHDGGLHYYRVVAMRHALEDGLPASRWLPDLAFGYGFPFFNYRAALSYYLALALYLTGLSLPQALNLVYIVALGASAIGAYLLGRDLFGELGGLVAAASYVYAPYPLIDALFRGNMPESLALALLPFILWSFRRLLLYDQTRYLLTSAGLLALLWLTHNISSLLFTPFLALYLLVIWMARGRRDHLVRAGVGLTLGIGLTTFFWAPAVLEKDDVQLYLSRSTLTNDYHYNFVNLSEVLAPPQPADTALLNPPLRLPLGLPLAVVATVAATLALWEWRTAWAERRDVDATHRPQKAPPDDDARLALRERQASLAFFALSSIFMIFMATPASVWIWENVPLIPFVQFPWRFIGRAVLPLSLLAAAFADVVAQITGRATGHPLSFKGLPLLAASGIILLLVLSALPFTYPAAGYCPAKPQPNILDLFAYEHATGLVGVDPVGSYFPVTVQVRPTGSPLEAQYAANLKSDQDRPPVARFDATILPAEARIRQAEYAPNQAKLELDTPTAFRARYLTFAFPGWRVLLDGQPTEIIPSNPEGLITFDVPAGRHIVEVDWGSTPVRSGATLVTLLALVGTALVGVLAMRNHLLRRIRSADPAPSERKIGDSPNAQTGTHSFAPGPAVSMRQMVLLGGLALGLLVLKLLVVDRYPTPFRQSGLNGAGTLPGVEVPLDIHFEDGVRLLGYDRSSDTLPADGMLHLAFYWSAETRPTRSYRATAVLVGPDGQLWSPKNALPRRGYSDPPPSPAWGDGHYAVEGMDVKPHPGTPPGRYDLLLTVFDRETLSPLNILNEMGQVSAPNLVVGQIELSRPERASDPADLSVQNRLDAEMGPLTLVGVDLDREEAAPGMPMLITIFWHVDQERATRLPDLTAQLALVDQRGAAVMTWVLPPARTDWPTTRWEPGDLWRAQHALRIPGSLESGQYTWHLQLSDLDRPGVRFPSVPVALGELQIDAPDRRWQAPPLQLGLEAELGDSIILLGANLEPADVPTNDLQPGATLTVTLAWQAQTELETSYHVFLHLLRPDGSLLVQSDGEPARWTRPTSGWAVGEVVLDQRVLEIPADAATGEYLLVTGLYDPTTKTRLTLSDESTAVTLTQLFIRAP